jgi:hypothetical protein
MDATMHNQSANQSSGQSATANRNEWRGGGCEGRLADFVPRPFRRAGADLRVVRPMSAPIHKSAVPGISWAHSGARSGQRTELEIKYRPFTKP